MTTRSKDIRKVFRDDFVVFILTHGRADNVVTYGTIRKIGYKGRIVLVVDDEDEQVDDYKRRYGEENVYVFNKKEVAETFDEGVRGDRRTVVYARNACFDIARELGYRYFMELDDDYRDFGYTFTSQREYYHHSIRKGFDKILVAMLRYYVSMPDCVKSIATAQNGDFVGGGETKRIRLKRKAMNSFICDTERPFQFVGRINEDVNTYTCNTSRGEVFFTLNMIRLAQSVTQANGGGMTDVYLDTGTYLKSFFSVMYHPSGVKIGVMGVSDKRLHHKINWTRTAPRIMEEKWKKKA